MAINFPHNPNVNDVHTESSLGRSWKWDGTTWLIYSSSTTGIAFGDLSVSQQAASGSGSLTYNNAGIFTYTPPAGGGGGSSTFIGLNDTPSSLTAGKWLKVNVGGTALEWTDAPAGNDTNDYVSGASLVANTLTLTRTGSQSLSDISVNLASLNTVPTTITVADESQDTECYPLFSKDPTGDIDPKTGTNIKFNSASGQLEAGSFKKTGGTAAEFLKADGSIDSTTYLSSAPSYALNDLSNVDAVTGVANGKILKYNGTSWEVADDQSGGGSGGGGNVAVGSVMIWSGSAVSIPSGWQLCDGTNGSPDLRDKFVVGAGSTYAVDATGGSKDSILVLHSHTINNHTHSFSDSFSGNTDYFDTSHTHGFSANATANVQTSYGTGSNALYGGNTSTMNSGTVPISFTLSDTGGPSANSNHRHGFSGSVSGTTGNPSDTGTNNQGSSGTDANLPPYYSLCYIYCTTASPATTFIGLSDTPGSYTANQWLKVNSAGNGVEFTNAPSGTNTTYDLTASDGSVATEEKIILTGSDSSEDAVTLAVSGSLTIARSNNTITFGGGGGSTNITNNADNRLITGSATAGELNAEASFQCDGNALFLSDDKAIKFGSNLRMQMYTDGSANYIKTATDGSGAFPLSFYSGNTEAIKIDSSGNTIVGEDLTISGNLTVSGTTTTVNTATLSIADNLITLNSDYSGSSPTENAGIEVQRGTAPTTMIRWNESDDKWQYTNDGSTFSDIGTSSDTLADVTGRGSTTTTACQFQNLTATGTLTAAFLNVKDPKIVLNSDFSGSGPTEDAFLRVERGSSADVNIKWNESSDKWQYTNDGSNYFDLGGSTDTNNYASSLSWNSGNGVLTVNRSGLSALTVDLDGRYATGTIPTNNNQLTNGANYVTSSGTISNSESIRIRTDTGNTMHNLVFVDSYSDNQFQTLKIDNATNSLCYNPSSNRLIGQDFQSFRMTSWGNDYGDYGQFLMSVGSGAWEWSQYVEQTSSGELLLKSSTGSDEGGHLQFEDMNGNTSYAIDVYRNNSSGDKVLRFIDQSQSLERFSVGPQGQWGIGHVGSRNYGSTGQVMISGGPSSPPYWGNHSQISGSSFASTAQGATADTANSDIDKIYTQLNAIGNDDTITTVAQLKTALLALVRS